MESRARRFNPHAAPDESPLARPSTLNLHSSSSKGHHGRAAGGSSPITWIVRLFVVILCCGLALQWWVWGASSGWSNGVASSDEQVLQEEERIANGWMNHLRRVDPEESKVDGDDDADATDATAKLPLPTNPTSAEEYQARRKSYDPANHSKDQKKVVDMVKWAWKGYATYAYGRDSLNVRLMEGTGLPSHDMALTLVDSLDTLYLVGMFDEFDKASKWVAKNMEERIFVKGFISFFETTIRLLGGLLSSYNLSGHPHLLELADKLGNALSPAFTRHEHGVPDKDYDIVNKRLREAPSLAEIGSLQLEFKYLARLTGKVMYRDQVEHVMNILQRDVAENYPNGLLPVIIRQGRVAGGKVTLGANGDSYYEYLLKQWLLSGKQEEKYKKAYITAVNGIMDKLVAKTKPSGLVFIGELVDGKLEPKMDHLVCFVPGMLALGYMHGMPKEHLTLAEQLLETCYQMYAQMEAKLAPEIAYFHVSDDATEDLDIHPRDAFNLLRPETVESLMILYRVTRNEKYRAYGREIMAAFDKQCKLEKGGYTSIGNVATGPVEQLYREEMESFFIAETLKYLFLLFSDDSICPLDQIVFNTEAHPFPIEQPVRETIFAALVTKFLRLSRLPSVLHLEFTTSVKYIKSCKQRESRWTARTLEAKATARTDVIAIYRVTVSGGDYRRKLMGSGASTFGHSSASSYRFGQVTKEKGDSQGGSQDQTSVASHPSSTSVSRLMWVGKTLEMPPKPFSLDNYFQFHAVVGTGMVGKVRLVQHRKTKKFYALKSLKKKEILAMKLLQQLETEREALLKLTKLPHPFLARYFGSLQTTCHVHFLIEYVPGGELFHRLHAVGRFTNDEAKFYATELLLFIEFCHNNGYMYRDLKPENIMLDGQGHVKVVDFGFAKKIANADDRTSTCVGTPQYLAPEQLTNSLEKRSYSKSVDWWAWACVIYEMVNGTTPFFRNKDDSPFELYTRIAKGQVPWPSRMHQSLRDLLRKMLTPDVSKRLCDVEAIKQHAWFDHVDWQEVEACELEPPYVPGMHKEGDHSNFDEYPNSAEETKSPESTFAKEFRHF